MADKSFGIKELNLISSGTPKIESPNNLNLSAVTVAISTNATVGGTLDVDGHTELDNVNISGVSTFAGITTVTGQTLFAKQIGVSGFSTFFNDVKFTGASYDALWDTSENRLEFKDGASAVFGTGDDLEIKHSGGNTTLKNITGQFRIAGNDIRLQNQTSSADFIKVNSTGSVVTGVLTATSFSGSLDASDLASGTIPDARFPATLPAISGVNLTNLPAGTPTNSDIQVVYTVTANGSSAYRFAGNGTVSTEDNPDVYLIRGLKYRFINNSGGSHPFEIRGSSGGTAYSVGVTNNGASSGNIDFQVPYSSPSHLYYQCTSHGGMVGNLYIRGAGGNNTNVGVTTFTGGLTVKALNINTSGAGDGDLLSNGGSDGIFGIFNTTNSGEISLNIKDSGGTYNNILSLVNDRATIDGNVGIGTTNPLGMLEVQKNGVPAIISNYNNSKHVQIDVGGSGAGIQISTGHYFAINHQPYADRGTNNNLTERLRITSGGNVLCNSSTPTYFGLPRVTTTEKNALSGMVGGELVYDTDIHGVFWYDDNTSQWRAI